MYSTVHDRFGTFDADLTEERIPGTLTLTSIHIYKYPRRQGARSEMAIPFWLPASDVCGSDPL